MNFVGNFEISSQIGIGISSTQILVHFPYNPQFCLQIVLPDKFVFVNINSTLLSQNIYLNILIFTDSMFILAILILSSICPISAVSLDSTNCDGNCIQEMERLIEATPTNSIGGGIIYTPNGNERSFMSHFFRDICDSYHDVDECLSRCESRSKQVSDLKSAYAGLQFVCKERKEEFFGSLPCLSENESKGVRKCSTQINQSQETTQLFTNSIASREFHSMQMRFNALCRDLSSVIRCMLPVINDSCGEKPANLLLKFIGLEFSSFETLYRQLGFHSPLPVSCRTLIKHAMATDQRQIQKPFSRATAKFYKFYLHNNDRRHSSPFPFFILILLHFFLSIIFIIFSI